MDPGQRRKGGMHEKRGILPLAGRRNEAMMEGEHEDMVLVLEYPERTTRVAAELVAFLKRNVRVFSWSSDELTGIHSDVVEPKVNIMAGVRVVKQKKSHFGTEKDKVIEKQVQALLKARHMREVQFTLGSSMWSWYQS